MEKAKKVKVSVIGVVILEQSTQNSFSIMNIANLLEFTDSDINKMQQLANELGL